MYEFCNLRANKRTITATYTFWIPMIRPINQYAVNVVCERYWLFNIHLLTDARDAAAAIITHHTLTV